MIRVSRSRRRLLVIAAVATVGAIASFWWHTAELEAQLRELRSAPALAVSDSETGSAADEVPDVAYGERTAVVLVDAAALTDAIRPGGRADIIAAYDVGVVGAARTEVVVAGARVLGIGPVEQSVAVSFALSEQESLAVAFAEAFSSVLRLAAVPPTAGSSTGPSSYAPRLAGDAVTP